METQAGKTSLLFLTTIALISVGDLIGSDMYCPNCLSCQLL
ncbi:MAG: hypothetical protein ACMUEM_04030 [Flavobacteriales bacterium AspAUS03]